MANAPAWFNADFYFQDKLKSMGGSMDSNGLIKAFSDAGFDATDTDSLYLHFTNYGQYENLSPNPYFDVDSYMYAKAFDFYGKLWHTTQPVVTQEMINTMWMYMKEANLNPWQHYLQYGAQEGINPSTDFSTADYYQAKVAKMNADAEGGRTDWTVSDVADMIAKSGLTALTHYFDYGQYEGLSFTPSEVEGSTENGIVGKTFNLGAGNTFYGTSANDTFHGYFGNDLNNATYIDGGKGYDTVYSILDANNNAAGAQPRMFNVEKLVLQAQAAAPDSGNNLVRTAHLDAGKIANDVFGNGNGLKYIMNDDSRAAMVIENVRAFSNKMTIGWADADPGTGDRNPVGVDYEVYFDSQYLKADSTTNTGTLYIKLMDIKGADETDDASPLLTNPYDQFFFKYTPDGGTEQLVHLKFYETTAKANYWGPSADYNTLKTAFQDALNSLGLGGVIEVQVGDPFTASSDIGPSWTGHGFIINLICDSGKIEAGDTVPDTGWGASGVIPADSAYASTVSADPGFVCPLIKTNIHLDNVGHVQWTDLNVNCIPDESIFGSEAGDMVVGSHDGRAGIERFDVVVDRGSWLSSLSSTNNILRMVTVVKGDINGDNHAGNVFSQANNTHVGELYIGRSMAENTPQAMDSIWTFAPVLLTTDGLVDVKYFTAKGYEGQINLGASLTAASYNKYLLDVDDTDQIDQNYAPTPTDGNFLYDLGDADDIINMTVNSGVAADVDFHLDINGNGGNDLINFQYTGLLTDQQILNMANMRTVVLNGGDGNDRIWSWDDGSVTANGGSGLDAIYVGQVGDAIPGDHNAVWAFNVDHGHREIDFTGMGEAQAHDNNFASILSAVNYTGLTSGHTLQVTVNFKGVTSTVDLQTANGNPIVVGATGAGTVSTVDINHAIIRAIENSNVLNKVLVGSDAAGYGLIVQSLIDGEMSLADLTVSFHTHPTTGANVSFDFLQSGAYVTDFATFDDGGLSAPTVSDPTVFSDPAGVNKSTITFDFADMAPVNFGEGIHALDVVTFTVGGNAYTYTVQNADVVNSFDQTLINVLTRAISTDDAPDLVIGNAPAANNWQFGTGVTLNDGIVVLTSVDDDEVDPGFNAVVVTVTHPADSGTATEVTGDNVLVHTRNWVNGGEGNDVLTLSATAEKFGFFVPGQDTDVNGRVLVEGHYSEYVHDTVVHSSAAANSMGDDTIFNFVTGDRAGTIFAVDNFDFTALHLDGAVKVVTATAANNSDGILNRANIVANTTAVGGLTANHTDLIFIKEAGDDGTGNDIYTVFTVKSADAALDTNDTITILGSVNMAGIVDMAGFASHLVAGDISI